MANSYLNRTFSGTPTMNTFTVSFWIKRTTIGATQRIISARVDGNNESTFYFSSSDQLNISSTVSGATKCDIKANRLFRDTNAWYHIVVQKNTTLATANDRVKIWVNGVEETNLTRSTTQVQNEEDFFLKSTATNEIGRRPSNNDQHFGGYFSHFCVVQGSVIAPTSFGETDSTSGIWKFKSPSGVSFGTNGFHLKFENSGALGTDSSGNSQTWTSNGNLKQALDTPSNNHATMATPTWYDGTISTGGNSVSTNQTSYRYQTASIGVNKGRWYWEAKLTTLADYALMGITDSPAPSNAGTTWILGSGAYDYSVVYNTAGGNGHEYNNAGTNPTNTPGAWMGGFSQGDIVTFALDLDSATKKFYIGVGGSWANGSGSTNQTFGNASGFSIIIPENTDGGFYFPACGDYGGGTSVFDFNFGNGFFGTTAISSAGSNGNGSLFEYDVPSGYYALNTKNLNTHG